MRGFAVALLSVSCAAEMAASGSDGGPQAPQPPPTEQLRDSSTTSAPDAGAQAIDEDADIPTAESGAGEATTITIATFNIQQLGSAKSSRPDVMASIGEIVRKYDVVAVQEIKDSSGGAAVALLDSVNSLDGPDYSMLLSGRTGLQPDDQNFREQYAVLYNSTRIESLGGEVLYDDSAADSFQREPFLAHLKVIDGAFGFVVVTIHTQPDAAVAEIAALHGVVEWGQAQFPDEDDFVVLGDFNASCSYASPGDLDALPLRGPEYLWIVPDDADTNVSPNTACAYDRIVATTATADDYAGSWGVDEAYSDTAVSDHWPVWATFWATR